MNALVQRTAPNRGRGETEPTVPAGTCDLGDALLPFSYSLAVQGQETLPSG